MPTTTDTNVSADRLSLWQVLLACGACAILGALATAGVTALVISASIGERVEQTLEDRADAYIRTIDDAGAAVALQANRLAGQAGQIVSDISATTNASLDRVSTEVVALSESVQRMLNENSSLRGSLRVIEADLAKLGERSRVDGQSRLEQIEGLRAESRRLLDDLRQLTRDAAATSERIDDMAEQVALHKGMLDILYAERKLAGENR